MKDAKTILAIWSFERKRFPDGTSKSMYRRTNGTIWTYWPIPNPQYAKAFQNRNWKAKYTCLTSKSQWNNKISNSKQGFRESHIDSSYCKKRNYLASRWQMDITQDVNKMISRETFHEIHLETALKVLPHILLSKEMQKQLFCKYTTWS